MRKLIVLLLAALLTCPPPALAHRGEEASPQSQGRSSGHGGFHHKGVMRVTEAAQVPGAYIGTPCELTGHLIEQRGYDRYAFRDKSGTVVVDIDRKRFRGQTVTSETLVRIIGQVDLDRDGMGVDVESLEIVR